MVAWILEPYCLLLILKPCADPERFDAFPDRTFCLRIRIRIRSLLSLQNIYKMLNQTFFFLTFSLKTCKGKRSVFNTQVNI